VALDVALSPKVQAYEPIVPPVSVDVSVKFAVRPEVVNVKFATGVPPLLAAACVTVVADTVVCGVAPATAVQVTVTL